MYLQKVGWVLVERCKKSYFTLTGTITNGNSCASHTRKTKIKGTGCKHKCMSTLSKPNVLTYIHKNCTYFVCANNSFIALTK